MKIVYFMYLTKSIEDIYTSLYDYPNGKYNQRIFVTYIWPQIRQR